MSNPVVLAVAAIFVVAGLALIVLSFLVGREGRQETVVEEGGGDFLDRPLTTDIADELGGKPAAPATAGDDEPTLEFASPAQTAQNAQTVPPAQTVPTRPSGLSAGEPSLPDAASIARAAGTPDDGSSGARGTGDGMRDFAFRVTLGFRLLERNLLAQAADQFLRATGLTDDRKAKLTLFVEIGNAFRKQQMPTQAAAAYSQATAYTDNQLLMEELERTLQDLSDGA